MLRGVCLKSKRQVRLVASASCSPKETGAARVATLSPTQPRPTATRRITLSGPAYAMAKTLRYAARNGVLSPSRPLTVHGYGGDSKDQLYHLDKIEEWQTLEHAARGDCYNAPSCLLPTSRERFFSTELNPGTVMVTYLPHGFANRIARMTRDWSPRSVDNDSPIFCIRTKISKQLRNCLAIGAPST